MSERRWQAEDRTGLELVERWSETFKSKAEAARQICLAAGPMDPDHFRIWLREPDRRLDPNTGRQVALAVGIPFEAVMFKNERICDLVRESQAALKRSA